MRILGIESTCDETACAVVENGKTILSNIVSSQIDLHKPFGGVVPELASRRHIEVIIPVIDQALSEAGLTLSAIDLIAIAQGPGLIGSLLVGINTAKALAFACGKPLVGINHLEAHLYAAIMSSDAPVHYPCLGVILSGGHTALVLMKDIATYELISETVDDAIGEAFDKVAKMMDLPYPGGPNIEELAKEGSPHYFTYKAGQVKGKPYHFSFSGLKTAVLYSLKGLEPLSQPIKQNIAASFQRAAFEDILKKTLRAADDYGVSTIIFGGGVTNNKTLRQLFKVSSDRYLMIWPTVDLSLDNAAMIAGLAYHRYLDNAINPLELQPLVRIPFTNTLTRSTQISCS